MSKGQEWKQYEERRKRDKTLFIRCTEEERQLFYALAKIKNMNHMDLLKYLVEQELEREEEK